MKYNLIVIGAGPAGMMAAGRAAENGAHVLLIDKNPEMGRKLLITGKGRCNITQDVLDPHDFIEEVGRNASFLFKGIYHFGPAQVMDFFEEHGLPLKVERGKRVFPQSDSAEDVLLLLQKYLKKNHVEIRLNAEVKKINVKKNKITTIELADGESLLADNYLIATGGKSYPGTGSTGDAYNWLGKMGHNIILPRPALAPIITEEKWIVELQGLSLKNVNISLWQDNKKEDERFGEALFTHEGMSGPIILDMAAHLGELLLRGPVRLKIDFKAAIPYEELDERLQREFQELNKKDFGNYLKTLLPGKLVPVILSMSQIHPEKKLGFITKEDRRRLLHLLKEFELHVERVDGFYKAIITAGGVDIKEIDPNTMKSKIIDNLYLAGELLDIAGPTGGYNLQIAWTTGYLVGEAMKK